MWAGATPSTIPGTQQLGYCSSNPLWFGLCEVPVSGRDQRPYSLTPGVVWPRKYVQPAHFSVLFEVPDIFCHSGEK